MAKICQFGTVLRLLAEIALLGSAQKQAHGGARLRVALPRGAAVGRAAAREGLRLSLRLLLAFLSATAQQRTQQRKEVCTKQLSEWEPAYERRQQLRLCGAEATRGVVQASRVPIEGAGLSAACAHAGTGTAGCTPSGGRDA